MMDFEMPQMQILDILYSSSSPSPHHSFDLYLPQRNLQPPPPLLCFVHGGAWRSEDKQNYAQFARSLVLHSGFPVAVPNYRLSPKEPTGDSVFRHPGHALDILDCLAFLTSWEGPSGMGSVYDAKAIHLIGHSCGAHMLSSIFLDSSSITPSLTPLNVVLQSVKTIALSEGLYDLDLLVSDYPEYRSWFIASAFGDMDSYSDFSVTKYPSRTRDIRWLIIHSTGDTLVNVDQSKVMYEHLHRLLGQDAEGHVKCDFHSLSVEHNDLFADEGFVELLVKFASRN